MALVLPGARELGRPASGRSGRPIASYDASAIGRGVAQLGAGIQSLATDIRANETQQRATVDKTALFETERRFQEFESAQTQALQELGQREQPGAFGFKERFQETYLKSAKEFMATVPDELKPAFDVKLYNAEDRLTTSAGTFEREQRKGYYSTNVNEGLTRIEGKLYSNPQAFDEALWEGEQFIDAIPDEDVGPIEKDALRRAWKAKAQLAALNGMAPIDRLRALGEAPSGDDIIQAMIGVESGGKADAVSPAGAIGLMQVMPGTGQEIARELGDKNFPANGGIDRVTEYLKNPDVSRAYGTYYFNKMMARYDGDTEAALIAYNGGPGRADRWLSSGRNDAVIPAESANYYKKVLARVKGYKPEQAAGAEMPIVIGDAKGLGRLSNPDISGVSPVVIDRFKQVQNAFGASIPIVSGFRDPIRNAKAGGASKSKHMDGEALDLDVSGMSKEDRVRLIETASSLGFTGIGVYDNSIHLDIGSRRVWGPSHGKDSVPSWAADVVKRHLAGTTSAAGALGGKGFKVDPRFADMSYIDRATLAASTQKQVDEATAAAKVQATATYKAYDDAFGLNIELGKIVSEVQIIDDPMLNDGDITKHLRAFRAKTKEDADVRDLVSAIVAGDAAAAVNGFDADERKNADKAYGAMMKAATPETQAVITETFVRSTGYIPKQVQAAVRQGVASTDAGELAAALSQADALDLAAPISFGAFEGGKDTREKLALYRHMVNDLGMAGDAAAERILRMNDPAAKVNREVLKPAADKFVKELKVSDVTDAFDPGLFSAEPGAGIMPVQVNGLLAEYREIAEQAFYEVGGDAGAARAVALAELRTRWNISTISGSANLMRTPPEMHYPAIDGSHEYLRDDAMETAKEYVSDLGLNRTVENIAIIPGKQTRADIEAGRPPRYRLFYQFEEDGQKRFDEVFGGEWGVDAATMKERASRASSKAKERFLARRGVNDAANEIERAAAREADAALIDTQGPDWMKALAASGARERGRMDADMLRSRGYQIEEEPAEGKPVEPTPFKPSELVVTP